VARGNVVAHSSTSLSTIVGVAHLFFQLSDIPVSDRGTLEGLTQFRFVPPRVCRQAIGTTRHLRSNMREGRFCATLFKAARKSLILKRRDVGVVDRARLESVCRGNSTEGSNPSLSANAKY
jgi:hypothetical protein